MHKIKFEAEIDATVSPVEVRIKATKDPWTDFGYLLEIMAFMSKVVMDGQEMSKEQVVGYIFDYLNNAISDYKAKP
ncbi:MAG: hypothetical protein HYZ51_04730 [Candidatus Doudnabacteria bacterium]|nr:hypothetical protein [Candidatus Doudnabacteria bacterium]